MTDAYHEFVDRDEEVFRAARHNDTITLTVFPAEGDDRTPISILFLAEDADAITKIIQDAR